MPFSSHFESPNHACSIAEALPNHRPSNLPGAYILFLVTSSNHDFLVETSSATLFPLAPLPHFVCRATVARFAAAAASAERRCRVWAASGAAAPVWAPVAPVAVGSVQPPQLHRGTPEVHWVVPHWG